MYFYQVKALGKCLCRNGNLFHRIRKNKRTRKDHTIFNYRFLIIKIYKLRDLGKTDLSHRKKSSFTCWRGGTGLSIGAQIYGAIEDPF